MVSFWEALLRGLSMKKKKKVTENNDSTLSKLSW